MVSFHDKGFTIHIHTGVNPLEEWMTLHSQLVNLLGSTDTESGITNQEFYTVLNLLDELLPSQETAKKMVS